MTREYLVEAVIVADCGHDRRVGIKCDARQGQAISLKTTNQFGDKVLSVGSRASVAASKNLGIIGDRRKAHLNGLTEWGGQRHAALGGNNVILEVGSEFVCEIHSCILS